MSRMDANLAVLFASRIANGDPIDEQAAVTLQQARQAAKAFVSQRRIDAAEHGRRPDERWLEVSEAAFVAGYLVRAMSDRDRDFPDDP